MGWSRIEKPYLLYSRSLSSSVQGIGIVNIWAKRLDAAVEYLGLSSGCRCCGGEWMNIELRRIRGSNVGFGLDEADD